MADAVILRTAGGQAFELDATEMDVISRVAPRWAEQVALLATGQPAPNLCDYATLCKTFVDKEIDGFVPVWSWKTWGIHGEMSESQLASGWLVFGIQGMAWVTNPPGIAKMFGNEVWAESWDIDPAREVDRSPGGQLMQMTMAMRDLRPGAGSDNARVFLGAIQCQMGEQLADLVVGLARELRQVEDILSQGTQQDASSPPPPPPPPPPTPAGWHTDPYGRHELRYWDGTTWSSHVSDSGSTSIDPAG